MVVSNAATATVRFGASAGALAAASPGAPAAASPGVPVGASAGAFADVSPGAPAGVSPGAQASVGTPIKASAATAADENRSPDASRSPDARVGVPSARLLAALSQAFSYPWDGIAATLEALAGVEEARQAHAALQTAARSLGDRTAEQLAYTRLFIGSFKMEAPPYASYYLEESRTLNGQAAAEVAAVYAQFGLELEQGEKAPADHLRYLLAFLALLAQRYGETGEAAFAEAYADFLEAYVLTWIDDFQQLVERYAEDAYYPALVALIVETLKGKGDRHGRR